MRFLTLLVSLAACSYARTQAKRNTTSADDYDGDYEVPGYEELGHEELGYEELGYEEPEEPAAVPPAHFACAADADCVVRNVGNCCGYYPLCANSAAVLPHPCPDGGFGVCGFAEVDSCACGSKGGCVSYQGGNIVGGYEYA
ncbi:hypothetical protein N3K66_007706 [Trichothecium roseum]|uniref:Uncharacterized protein n=1 Tax=Trichothecium roseum TaxID=47278 RepID=A0ACC0UUR4_9HYPO|nr:hypothetical protein N3K66_007706 [Trichothecium roseum]